MEENNVVNTEQIEQGQQEPEQARTFTQAEVDRIVENRLNRERKRLSAAMAGLDPREDDLREREKAVELKEMKADARAALSEKGLPIEALDLLNYTDKESCDKSIEQLEAAFNIALQSRLSTLLQGGSPMKKAPQEAPDFALRRAFDLS